MAHLFVTDIPAPSPEPQPGGFPRAALVLADGFGRELPPAAFRLARKTRRIVTQNLVFAMAVILVLVAAALTRGIPLPLGVVGHEGSTVLVCLNGLRLLRKGKFGI